MCILSLYWENNENWVLTHNRDENKQKEFEAGFVEREFFGKEIYSPQDKVGGGTWIFYSDQFVACVLNGGFDFHMPGGKYKQSRGRLVLDLNKFSCVEDFFDAQNFNGVEPFTFVVIDRNQAKKYRLVWDGNQKHLSEIEKNLFVWSSATLYTEVQKAENKKIFLGLNSFQKEDLLEVHKKIRIVNHPFLEGVKTTSIAQIEMKKGHLNNTFLDTVDL